MNTCYVVPSSRPAGLFSFALLDGLHVHLRRRNRRKPPADFSLERLATAFMSNPDLSSIEHTGAETSRLPDEDRRNRS